MSVSFIVHGPASTKGSTRSFVSRTTGRVVTTADAASLPVWTQAVAWSAKQAGVPMVLRPRGVRLLVTFVFPKPKSVKREQMTVKPDADKILRALFDALSGIAYEDDAQVVDAAVMKLYGPRAETHVTIDEVVTHEGAA